VTSHAVPHLHRYVELTILASAGSKHRLHACACRSTCVLLSQRFVVAAFRFYLKRHSDAAFDSKWQKAYDKEIEHQINPQSATRVRSASFTPPFHLLSVALVCVLHALSGNLCTSVPVTFACIAAHLFAKGRLRPFLDFSGTLLPGHLADKTKRSTSAKRLATGQGLTLLHSDCALISSRHFFR
jgi:hypothetical protein